MSRNDDCTKGNLLDFLYHQKYYKLIVIELTRKTASGPQEINFIGKLKNDDATMFFLPLISSKNYPKLFFWFINCHRII